MAKFPSLCNLLSFLRRLDPSSLFRILSAIESFAEEIVRLRLHLTIIMGQSLGSASPKQSKDELLFQFVLAGNVEGARALYGHGANLECTDKEGNTPLIVACKDSALFYVAKALIDLGANVNAYGPGRYGGTPLHHAASRGLEQTVQLLLLSGGNALLRNDDGQTALDMARTNQKTVVVRAIEHHICLFSGWLREFHGPAFLRSFSLQLLATKVWAVVLPYSTRDPTNARLQLVLYSNQQDAKPYTVIPLWNAKIEEPKFDNPDAGMTIFDPSSNSRHQLAPFKQGDKDQLRCLYDACRRNGITQVGPTPRHQHMEHVIPDTGYEDPEEALQLAMALSASIQSAMEDRQQPPNSHDYGSGAIDTNGWGDAPHAESHNGWGAPVGSPLSEASSSGQVPEKAAKEKYNGWDVPSTRPTAGSQAHSQMQHNSLPVNQVVAVASTTAPSAPPVPTEATMDEEGPIHYPSIDLGPLDLSVPATEQGVSSATSNSKDEGSASSSSASSVCIICWDAPVQGACVPCGHMAGCMECLSDIKGKKGTCPVCRAKLTQVIKLYSV
ncbi:unnamed protein product [Linum tenue]|uniref:RING-type domain-containing protein n=1 Tax=Linum tenue TaxID=586396 RepID=A0AAV0LLX1_9ROSI|nr:unnamed protein product [Linum tenue]